MTVLADRSARPSLWAEFVALYVGAPVLMLAFFGSYSLFAVLWLLALVALGLLALTPGFRWRDMLRPPPRRDLPLLAGLALATAAVCVGFALALRPESFLSMPLDRTGLWLMIVVFYPPLSALPQEIIYRTLFFERYGALMPNPRVAVAVSGVAFGLGHLFYMNPVTIAMTAVGGAVIGWTYLRNRSLIFAVALHGLAGQIIFTVGLGLYFYSGAIGRAW